jgi:hypothetical protein
MGRASRRKRIERNLRPSAEKASTRLIKLIEPYVEEPETRDSYEVLVIIGVLAWNLAVVPEAARLPLAEDLLRDAATSGLPLTRAVLSNLVARKLELFPEDQRFIEKFDVRQEGQRFTVLLATSEIETGG